MKPHSRTWQNQAASDMVNLQSLLDSCYVNIREAARRESELRELRARLQPDDPRVTGTPTTPPIGYQILRARFEQDHWREYQRHYLQRIALEGKDQLVRVLLLPRGQPQLPPAAPVEDDPRLPRERQPGDDDGELPF